MQTQISPEQVRQLGDALAENGRVLATLDDWRAIVFSIAIISVIVIVALIAVIVALLRSNRLERINMATQMDRAWGVADKFGDAAGKLTGEIQVTQSLNARVESALGSCEDLLHKIERRRGSRAGG